MLTEEQGCMEALANAKKIISPLWAPQSSGAHQCAHAPGSRGSLLPEVRFALAHHRRSGAPKPCGWEGSLMSLPAPAPNITPQEMKEDAHHVPYCPRPHSVSTDTSVPEE